MRLFWATMIVAGLATGRAQAQAFEPGYVVTAAGDTLRGEIENRSWQSPPEAVLFRLGPGQPVRTYPRPSLQAFRLNRGRYFRAEVVPLDRGARTQVNTLPTVLTIKQRPDSLLAEVLVDGPVPLLRAVVDGVSHYFVRRPGQPFLELADRKYLSMTNGSERVVDANNYKSQLAVYFSDCPAASKAAETAAFSAKGLAAVVQAFSAHCTDNKTVGADLTDLKSGTEPFAFNWGLLAGVGYNHLRFNDRNQQGEEPALLNNLNVDGRLHPVGGVYLDMLLPGRRWAVHGEAAVSTFGRRGTFPLAGGAGSYTWYGTKLDMRLGGRYMLKQTTRQELFAGAGLNFNYTLSNESRQQYGTGALRVTAGGVVVPTQAGFLGRPDFAAAPYLEAGVRRGRFTGSLDALLLSDAVGYNDPLTVQYAIRNPNSPPGSPPVAYDGYSYSAPLLAFRAVLGFRLSRQADQIAKK